METKPISPAQLKKVQTMFTKLGFEPEDKQGIISSLTSGRATSAKDVTFDEAKRLINHLIGKAEPEKSIKRQNDQEAANNEIKAIYRLSYEIGMCYGDTLDDKKMNCAKINKFCRERGTVKKDITEMTLAELRKTHRHFETVLQNGLGYAVKQLIKESINQKIKKL